MWLDNNVANIEIFCYLWHRSRKFVSVKRIFAFILILLTLCSAGTVPRGLYRELDNLDATLAMAPEFHTAKEQLLKTLKERASDPSTPSATAYELWGQFYRESFPYSFSMAADALEKQDSIARKLGDSHKKTDVLTRRALLLCVTGMYLESSNISKQIDTTSFDAAQELEWCNYQQRFNCDFAEYSPTAEDHARMLEKVAYYRSRIIAMTDDSLPLHQQMLAQEYLRTGRAEKADSVLTRSLDAINPSTHDYAIAAYYQAVACRDLGRRYDSATWFLRSALADTRASVKDNASLFSLAQILFQDNIDIARAFRYTQTSLQDALDFNSKLRPWQIALSLPAIENAFIASQKHHVSMIRTLLVAISILAAGLLIILVMVVRLNRKLRASHTQIIAMNSRIREYSDSLAESNEKLQLAIAQLSEANTAKEEYIGLFLSMCSDYIDKLRKFVPRTEADAEVKAFYKAFDNAFLQLYPNFVSEFNALLRPEARIELKKDELLNTELRIFALIRLGITQSSHIASLLRYSVNTIYNYRAQIKNAALSDRENFEEIVKTLGSASPQQTT